MKGIKAFVVGAVASGVLAIAFTQFDVGITWKENEVKAEEKATVVPKEVLIDEEIIFGEMKEKAIIIGLEKKITKSNGVDASVETGWGWFDKVALSKKLVYKANGSFHMGLDLTGMKKDDVKVDQKHGIVTILVPKPSLIALDLPYEKCEFIYDKGLFRRHFTKKDEQMIWKEIRKTAVAEIKEDAKSLETAKKASYHFIEELLLHIEGVEKVVFIEKG